MCAVSFYFLIGLSMEAWNKDYCIARKRSSALSLEFWMHVEGLFRSQNFTPKNVTSDVWTHA